MPKALGIIGGAGPHASLRFHQYLLEETAQQKVVRSDGDHLDIFHFSLPSRITDRTGFLLGREKVNPALGAAEVASLMAKLDRPMLTSVPCNTFHASRIFSPFQHLVRSRTRHLEVVDMLEVTARALGGRIGRVGVMSTTGTRSARIFEHRLAPHGIQVTHVSEALQPALQEAIYDPDWGVKAVAPVTERARSRLLELEAELQKQVDVVILGCTELPLALDEQDSDSARIDPMRLLAGSLVEQAFAA